MNPTVSVHNSAWYLINNTVDWVSDVLFGGDKETRDNQDDKGGFVMETEHIVVDADGVEFDEPLDTAKHVKHDEAGLGNF